MEQHNFSLNKPATIHENIENNRRFCDYINEYVGIQYKSIRDNWKIIPNSEIDIVNNSSSIVALAPVGKYDVQAATIEECNDSAYECMECVYRYISIILNNIRENIDNAYANNDKLFVIRNTCEKLSYGTLTTDYMYKIMDLNGLWLRDTNNDSDNDVDYKLIYKYASKNDYMKTRYESYKLYINTIQYSVDYMPILVSHAIDALQGTLSENMYSIVSIDKLENSLLSSEYHLERYDNDTLIIINDYA